MFLPTFCGEILSDPGPTRMQRKYAKHLGLAEMYVDNKNAKDAIKHYKKALGYTNNRDNQNIILHNIQVLMKMGEM